MDNEEKTTDQPVETEEEGEEMTDAEYILSFLNLPFKLTTDGKIQ